MAPHVVPLVAKYGVDFITRELGKHIFREIDRRTSNAGHDRHARARNDADRFTIENGGSRERAEATRRPPMKERLSGDGNARNGQDREADQGCPSQKALGSSRNWGCAGIARTDGIATGDRDGEADPDCK